MANHPTHVANPIYSVVRKKEKKKEKRKNTNNNNKTHSQTKPDVHCRTRTRPSMVWKSCDNGVVD